MLIIIEGPDNSGKSTLVRRLRQSSSHRHVSMLEGRTMDHDEMRRRSFAVLRDAEAEPTKGILCERFHPISDMVYRTLYGGRRAFNPTEFKSICQSLAQTAVIVHCRPPLSVAMGTALTEKGDDDPEWVASIQRSMPLLYEAYDRTMNKLAWFSKVPVVRYDHTETVVANELEGMLCAG